jgi:hypothetical protein
MDSTIKSEISYIKSKLEDLESLPLPWTEVEIATFHAEWLDSYGVMNKLKERIGVLDPEYLSLIERFRKQKEKIIALGLEYPDIP